jgi:hypothetical protein
MTGSSTQGIKTVLHPVSDLATAKAVYAALLGIPPQTDGSYYVGFEAEGQHIGLVPGGGPQGMTSRHHQRLQPAERPHPAGRRGLGLLVFKRRSQ